MDRRSSKWGSRNQARFRTLSVTTPKPTRRSRWCWSTTPRAWGPLWFSLENAQLSNVPFVFSNFYRLQGLCENDVKTCAATKIQDVLGTANSFNVPEDLKERFRELRDEDEGRSTGRTRDTFARRTLYLSAVTITTVGYGDIVPLTDLARAAVATEAITGIILIGLFLNALAYERDNL